VGDEVDRHGVELALLGFNCQAANRPVIPYDQQMVLRGKIVIERYWFGVLPLYVLNIFFTGPLSDLNI
jgi:hypothetical protein